MDYNVGFRNLLYQWLVQQGKLKNEDKNRSADEISIFNYTSEISQMLKEQGSSDTFVLSGNASDLTSDSSDNTIIKELYTELLKEDKFFNAIDTNKDGIISEEEQAKFFEAIKNIDGNDENISTDDMLLAANSIGTNTFEALTGQPEAVPTDISPAIESSGGATGSSGSSGYQPSGGGATQAPADGGGDASPETPLSVEEMSETELKNALSEKESLLQDKESELTSVSDGSHPDLAGSLEAIDEAYEAYQEELTKVAPELAEQLNTIVSDLSAKDTEISEKESEINTQEGVVSDAETELANAENTVSSLEANLSSLESQDKSNLTPEQTSDLEAKITQTRQKLEEAKEAKTAAEENLSVQEQTLQNLNDELETLKEEKTAIEEEKSDLEAKIAEEQPAITELMNNYNTLKADFEQAKAEKISEIKSEITNARNEISNIKTEIAARADKKDIKENLSFNSEPPLYLDDLETEISFIKDENGLEYLVYGPKNPDPNVEYPLMVNIPGGSEFGSDAEKLTNVNYGKFMQNMSDSDGAKFNGYMICVMLPEFEHWTNDKNTGRVDDVIEKFSQTHNIDNEKIALSGFSHGANGALYMGSHSRTKYCSVALMSCPGGINNGNVLDIQNRGTQVYGFLGSSAKGELKTSLEYMNHEFIAQAGADHLYQVDADHGQVVDYAFNMDKDGNGVPDIFQLIFNTKQN